MRSAVVAAVLALAALAGLVSAGTKHDPSTATGKKHDPLTVTDLSVSPSAFRVAPAAPVRHGATGGTIIRFRVSGAAAITIAIDRRLAGRRSGRTCVKPALGLSARSACWRYVAVGAVRRTVSDAGRVALAFSGHVGGRALPRGTYRATLTAVGEQHGRTAPNDASAPKTAVFTVTGSIPRTPVLQPGAFPGPLTTGTPPGWEPQRITSSDVHIRKAGAVVQNLQLINGADLYIDAPNVTVKDVDVQGGSIDNCDNWFGGHAPCEPGLLVEDTTIELIAGHTWADYDNTAQAALSSTLSTSGQISSLPVSPIDNPISGGTPLLIVLGANTQAFTTTADVSSGATSIPVMPATPTYPFPSGTTLATPTCEPAIWLGNYKAERVKVWRRCAGFYSGDRSGGAGSTEVDDSYVNLTDGPFNTETDPYHSEALQCYDSAGVTLKDDTFDTADASNGTSSFFCPSRQGNTSANVDGLLLMNGSNAPGAKAADGSSNYNCCGYVFRDGVPGTVTNLTIVRHTWSYYSIAVTCSLITRWQARIVTIDRISGGTSSAPYKITRVVRPQPCNTEDGN